jgi:recombination protein RecT
MNEIQTRQPQRMTFSMAINSTGYQKLINSTIKDPVKAQRFVTAITSAVAVNPLLQECDPATILSGALLGESLGLSPSPQLGQYYLVPFNNTKKGCKDAQFQLGYKGYVQLALRSGYYKKLNVFSVKAGELKKWDPITEELEIELIDDDEIREKTESIGYVATFTYQNGFAKTIYWSRKKMEAHALRYSKGYAARKGYTFWEKDFDAMAYKTMLRQLISKWGIMSIDLQTAFEQDVIVEEPDYLETEPPTLAPVTDIPQIAEDINVTAPEAPATEEPKRSRRKAAEAVSLDDL